MISKAFYPFQLIWQQTTKRSQSIRITYEKTLEMRYM